MANMQKKFLGPYLRLCLCLVFTLLCCSCDGPVLGIRVTGLPSDAKYLLVWVTANGNRLAVTEEVANKEYFGVSLPSDVKGTVTVEVAALDANRCSLAKGASSEDWNAKRYQEVTVQLLPSAQGLCELRYSLQGQGCLSIKVNGQLQMPDPSCQAGSILVPMGASISVSALPASGWYLAAIEGVNCTASTSICSFTTTGATSLNARFEMKSPLTVMLAGSGSGSVRSMPPGIDCGQQCSAPLSVPVTLLAEAAPGSYFVRWSETSCGTAATCTLQTLPALAITAVFARQVCSVDGWCWENPLPQGNALHGVFTLSSDAVWAVGAKCTILFFDGITWNKQNCPGTAANTVLRAVWASGRDDAWAVGDGGIFLHYTNGAWKQVTVTTSANINGVSGRSGGVVFAVGDSGTIFQLSGAEQWTQRAGGMTTANLYGVTVDPLGAIWAVGQSGVTLHSQDGMGWSSYTTTPPSTLRAVAGLDASAIAVGDSQAAFRWDSTQSKWVVDSPSSPPGGNLLGLAAGNSQVVAVGDMGIYSRQDSSGTITWSKIWDQIGAERAAPQAVSLSVNGAAWAVGSGGLMIQNTGGSWQSWLPASRQDLRAVHGSDATEVWAAGKGGALLRRASSAHGWEIKMSGTNQDLSALWVYGPGEIWIGGQLAGVRKFPSNPWQDTSFFATGLTAAWGDASSVWLSGFGKLYRYNRATPMTPPDVFDAMLTSLFKDVVGGGGLLWLVGTGGAVSTYQPGAAAGMGWKNATDTTMAGFNGAWFDGSQLWAVGTDCTIVRRTAATRADVTSNLTPCNGTELLGIDGQGTSLFVVGKNGVVLSGDATTGQISPQVSGSEASLFQVYAADARQVFVIGDSGNILSSLKP